MGKRVIAIVLFVPIAALILASTVFGWRFWRLLDNFGVQSFLGLNVHGTRGATQVGGLIAAVGIFLIWLAGPLFRGRGDLD